jgi:hypothetical protein
VRRLPLGLLRRGSGGSVAAPVASALDGAGWASVSAL